MPLIPPLPSPRTTQTNTPGECRSPGRGRTDSLHRIHFFPFHGCYALGHL